MTKTNISNQTTVSILAKDALNFKVWRLLRKHNRFQKCEIITLSFLLNSAFSVFFQRWTFVQSNLV